MQLFKIGKNEYLIEYGDINNPKYMTAYKWDRKRRLWRDPLYLLRWLPRSVYLKLREKYWGCVKFIYDDAKTYPEINCDWLDAVTTIPDYDNPLIKKTICYEGTIKETAERKEYIRLILYSVYHKPETRVMACLEKRTTDERYKSTVYPIRAWVLDKNTSHGYSMSWLKDSALSFCISIGYDEETIAHIENSWHEDSWLLR